MFWMSLIWLYQFETKSWIKIIDIRYTIPMSDFEANHSLTELSSVPTESKEASVSDRKKLLLFPELLYFIIIIFFIKI